MAVPCDTAKFREETSKKADSATRGRIAAVHNVGDDHSPTSEILQCSIHKNWTPRLLTGNDPVTRAAKFRFEETTSAPRHQGGVLSFLRVGRTAVAAVRTLGGVRLSPSGAAVRGVHGAKAAGTDLAPNYSHPGPHA